ncbi:Indoleamine 2,3-dioxygenase [Exophiala xenobiotica]|nr:Indoleamine 2,3-dioxygenase [Exophiala xenobiotica]KAK5268544.1 Indoleamine 2,3-dioxygenase [Exophiala xenobiotica]KAK5292888.1 Indoleamine 2,3-dioxygenase [Exophiala xenobiotica]KAK5336737.1 Indoleamine 2,3-dioxygenase [Exophiala xenobiotica]KAK5484490.1 Indoleamine 2,3-dioxygenase [Exophiala xenobiotica]
MLPPVPQLEDYGVSSDRGFLPPETPLQCLPHPVYDRWERIMNNFQSLLLSKRLRTVIDRLPIIPAAHLETEPEWRRAYSILTFMAHGYIWGGDKPSERLPPSITYPLLQVSDHLELPPVATYAGLCLWNFKPIFLSESLVLDNLSTLTTFTGSLDEQWFYLVSVAMEAKGGPSIPIMLQAIQAARDDDAQTVTKSLQSLAQTLDELGTLLVRMYENCDPHVFYNRIRPFLAGSKNMKDAGLPHGVFYDDGSRSRSTWRQYGGGSNAQSSMIQFFDIVLGVEHRPTGSKKDETSESEAEPGAAPKPRHNFIHEMRQYMPGPHRRFLQAVESVSNIRDYVQLNKSNLELCVAYDACLAMLRTLRDKHIQMVSRYIIVKSRESRSLSRTRRGSSSDHAPMTRGKGIASIRYDLSSVGEQAQKKKRMRGTGGTALIPFLKQARDETGEPAIDEWARKLLTGGRRTAADAEIAYESRLTAADLDADEPQIVGLAGAWSMEDAGGGLCAY